MINLNIIKTITAAVAIIFYLPTTEGAPLIISDSRVHSLDITPVLGRGYSIGTNSFQSTCLMVDEVTTPSFNYDYKFNDYSSDTSSERSYGAKSESSFSAGFIDLEMSAEGKYNSKSSSSRRYMVAVMKVQRYYSSVREELSPLSEDALTLLDTQDYIGFFKSCGPNYVRSIRRAQELTAIFSFTSSSRATSAEFAASFKASGGARSVSGSFASKSKFSSINKDLTIKIVGFGLGLNNEGSTTLVSTTLEEYNEVMKFAYISFTQSEDSHNIGMVFGIEIVPWVDNTAFQVASKLLDEEVEIPLPRSLIPKALLVTNRKPFPEFTNSDVFRKDVTCKERFHEIDRYGYCCEISTLFDTTAQEYSEAIVVDTVGVRNTMCKPVRRLDKSVVKNNMANNGEFVAHLDSIVRYRLNQLFTMEKCLTSVNSYDSDYDYHILKAQDSVKYDASIEVKYTVLRLKMALDPTQDYGLITALGKELDEFIEMYYSPCVAELFGTNVGSNPNVEPQYFMAYGWLTHDACAHLTCLADNTRWDREKGGCTVGVMTGNQFAFKATDDLAKKCALDNDETLSEEKIKCKHPEDKLKEFQDAANLCWKTDSVVPYYLMEHFCMPQLTGEIDDGEIKAEVEIIRGTCEKHKKPEEGAPVADSGGG